MSFRALPWQKAAQEILAKAEPAFHAVAANEMLLCRGQFLGPKIHEHREETVKVGPPMRVPGHICCGTPDCDWGFHLPDTSEANMNKCYAEFRKHCIERHGLDEAYRKPRYLWI
jgi:hypothetical protein